jgi:hypothetical protein
MRKKSPIVEAQLPRVYRFPLESRAIQAKMTQRQAFPDTGGCRALVLISILRTATRTVDTHAYIMLAYLMIIKSGVESCSLNRSSL